MAQAVNLKASGLYLNPDPLSEVPPGAMAEALNVVIDRPGLVQPRERFEAQTMPGALSGYQNLGVFVFEGDRIVVSRVGSSFKLYNLTEDQEVKDESAASLAFTIGAIGSFEAAGALFFTGDDGLRKLAAHDDTTAYLAGVPLAPMPKVEASGDASGFLADSDYIAYRVVFGRWDGSRKIVGPPSSRATFCQVFTPTQTNNVYVTVTLPDGVRAGDFVEVYRSGTVTAANPSIAPAVPGDEMRLKVSIYITADHISAGEVVFYDDDSDGGGGAYLYTNETQQGALQANYRPFGATAATWFNSMAFYGACSTEPRLTLSISSWNFLGGAGSVVRWPTGNIQNPGIATITLSSDQISFSVSIADLQFRVGQAITAANSHPLVSGDFPAETYITAIDYDTDTITVSEAATASTVSLIRLWDWIAVDGRKFYCAGESVLPSGYEGRYFNEVATLDAATGLDLEYIQNARDLCRAINEDGTASCYATCTGLGAGEHTITFWPKTLTGGACTITSTGVDFFDKSADHATGVDMEADGGSHRLAWSKLDQPEAVPVINYQDIGAEDKAILAIARTSDSLFVFKEDGTWRVTGETPESLRVDEFDSTLRLVHPNGLCEMGGQIIAWTTRGIMAVSEGGATELSGPLDQSELDGRAADILSDFSPTEYEGVFAFADEQARRVYLGLGNESSYDDYVYVYSARTGAWTRWTFEDSNVHTGVYDDVAGAVLFAGNSSSDPTLRAEASNYGYDDTYAINITDVTGLVVTITAGSGWIPAVGDVVNGTHRVTVKTSSTLFTVEWLAGSSLSTGAATAYDCTPSTVKWIPQTAGAPFYAKHWRDIVMACESYQYIPPAVVSFSAEGDAGSGSIELGKYESSTSPRYFRGSVSRGAARCARLVVEVTFRGIYTWILSGLGLTFEPESERL